MLEVIIIAVGRTYISINTILDGYWRIYQKTVLNNVWLRHANHVLVANLEGSRQILQYVMFQINNFIYLCTHETENQFFW